MAHLTVLRFPSEETKSPPKRARKPARKKVTDLPVLVHTGKGLWCRKVKGKFYYFGRVADDPHGATACKLWADQKDDLLAGRVPREKVEGLTLRDLCNKFLTSKKDKLTLGTLSPRSFVEYNRSTNILIETFGADRLVTDIRPSDFEELHRKLVKDGYGVSTIGREVIHIRSVFKYALVMDLIERPIEFGDVFKPPSRQDKRKYRAKQQHTHGKRLFAAAEVRMMLDAVPYRQRGTRIPSTDRYCSDIDFSDLRLREGQRSGLPVYEFRPTLRTQGNLQSACQPTPGAGDIQAIGVVLMK